MKKPIKTILSWCLAALIAVLIANGISFFYRSGAGSIPRENAYSTSIRTPNSRMVRGAEGYGINHVDKNGYLNDDTLPLRDNYILMMGSSHAEGLQVMQKDTMTSVLNRLIDPDTRTVYNLGTAGYTLPLIIQGFPAALEEFPHTKAVMIEISQLAFSADELTEAMNQAKYDPASAGPALMNSLDVGWRARNQVLELVPLISLLRQQFESMNLSMKHAFGIKDFLEAQKTAPAPDPAQVIDAEAAAAQEAAAAKEAEAAAAQEAAVFSSALNQSFALLRAEFSGPIILLYHSGVAVQPDGSLVIARDMRYYDAYSAACKQNGIVFVDPGDAFLRAYEEDFSVPYGFSNTTLLTGHLNRVGHKIVAEAFYKAWLNIQEEEKN